MPSTLRVVPSLLGAMASPAQALTSSPPCDVQDAALRYSYEPDFAAWRDRLTIYPLELRDLRTVERFCDALAAQHPRLHVLINNAAQTLTRPEVWGVQMERLERQAAAQLSPEAGMLLAPIAGGSSPSPLPRLSASPGDGGPGAEAHAETCAESADEGRDPETPVADPPAGVVAAGMDAVGAEVVRLDESGQPLDVATVNSWSRRLQDVGTTELLQTMAVNAASPFVLCRCVGCTPLPAPRPLADCPTAPSALFDPPPLTPAPKCFL